MAVTKAWFDQQLERLVDGLRPGTRRESVIGWADEYDELFGSAAWVTNQIFQRAVTFALLDDSLNGKPLPSPGYFLGQLQRAAEEIRREDDRTPALPGPQVRVVVELDPADPYSCTAEERERWAAENVWLRGYAKRLPVVNGAVLERLSAEDRAAVLETQAKNQSMANWTSLKPAERRAKERRTERQAAIAYLQGKGILPPDYLAKPRTLEPQQIVWRDKDEVIAERAAAKAAQEGDEGGHPLWPGAEGIV